MRSLVVVAACLFLCSCKQGEVYDRSLAETRTILRATQVPLHYFGPSADTAYSVSEPRPNMIEWKVTSDGSGVLEYEAVMEAVGDHQTRVTLTIHGAQNSGKFGDVAARMEKHRAVRDLYLATMAEATDSALEARPFDATRFYPQIATASMATMASMRPPADSGKHSN